MGTLNVLTGFKSTFNESMGKKKSSGVSKDIDTFSGSESSEVQHHWSQENIAMDFSL